MSSGKTIVGAGEILWDVYPDGPRFGGAPANFACSSAAFACKDDRIVMLSAVGTDELGQNALAALTEHNVSTEVVQQNDFETGNVLVTLDQVGVASYRFAENSAWDNVEWTDKLQSLAGECDAVCFGTLGQRSPVSRATIRRFLAGTNDQCLRVFDINLRDPFWDDECVVQSLELASVLKVNEDELPVIAKLLKLDGNTEDQLKAIASRFSLSTVALTMGPEGAIVWHQGALCTKPATTTNVVSTVGAGDAFTAALVRGLLNESSIDETLASAIETASRVCASPDSIYSAS